MPWAEVIPVVDHSVRGLCARPYPLHAKGCPNLGKCERCPPRAPLIESLLDLSRPAWAVYNAFDLAAHVAARRARHPDYTERQLYNCLYWQGTARKALRQEVRAFLRSRPGLKVVGTPEACGVNVTATMLSAGIVLEWPPRQTAHQVVLAGTGR